MSFWSWVSRLANHLRSNRVSADIDREVAFHLAERTDALIAEGMRADQARDEARRRFGSVAFQRERTRERDLLASIDTLIGDLRYALRSLRGAPAFTFVAVLSLALGIGANTAIFTLINAVLLRSLPVNHPEQLVALDHDDDGYFTNPLWEAIRDRQDVFSGMFAVGTRSFNLNAGGQERLVMGNWVSGDFYRTLGVRTIIGRPIVAADDYRGCPGVAVISAAFWQNEYAGAPAVVGRTISLDGHPFRIIGVNDPRFSGVHVGENAQVFVPLCSEAIIKGPAGALDRRSTWFLEIMGRPLPGLSTRQIEVRLATQVPSIVEATVPPNWSAEGLAGYRKMKLTVAPAAKGFSDLRMTYRKALYVLMAIVSLVLLVACANVANLLLARSTMRQHEMAVRLALGAGRGRLARQLITESLLLSSLGAVLGVMLASWGSRFLVSLLSRSSRAVALDLRLDLPVLAFTVLVATLTGLLFGLAPAWRAGRVDPQTAMKAQSRGIAEGHSRINIGKLLVAGQIALSLVLVTGAGLLLESWRTLATLDPGFHRDQTLVISASIRGLKLPAEQEMPLWNRIVDELRALPGVRGAATSWTSPVGHSSWNELLKVDGFTPKSEEDAVVWANAVSDRYFATLGVPLVAGRDFDSRETSTSQRVAIVSEEMALKFFNSSGAIGRRFQFHDGKDLTDPIEVIGIVGNTKYRSLRDSAQPIMYFPAVQRAPTTEEMELVLRTNGAPLAVVPALKALLDRIDPRITFEARTLSSQLDESMALTRTVATLSGFFGALALLLAAIGLYGIMAYTVARRRGEIGVRVALGAAQSRVVRMVLGETSRIVIAGVIVGVALSLAATGLIRNLLYGLEPRDPATLTVAALILVAVGLLAAALPAIRAARLDPVAALREE